jgi:hypothetical protein
MTQALRVYVTNDRNVDVARKYSLKCGYSVELRGLEPLRIPPEIPSELRRLFFR